MSTYLHSPWLEDLGWVLVHTLWQGAILWALLAMVFALARHRLSAATKHRLAWLTLTALAFAPVVTMIWQQVEKPETPPPAQNVHVSATPVAFPSLAPSATSPDKSNSSATLSATASSRPTDAFVAEASKTSWLGQLPIWFATAWLAGLALLTIRLLLGWRWVAELKRAGAKPELKWHEHFINWSGYTALRHVRVLVCPGLGVPLVVGWLRPVVCFPASLLTRLSIAEVEALMLHELAHLKRRDPLLQFWVTVVETLLFHNPAAHALASTVRQTGELACDDLVLEWKGDGKTYVRALAAAEEWRGAQFALAATGMGSLKHRIQRILGLGECSHITTLPQRFGIASVAGIALYLAIFGMAVPQLAKALTPDERVALITREREAMQVTPAGKEPDDFVAEGILRTEDGSTPTGAISVCGWSERYTTFTSKLAVGKKFTIEGRGNEMTVAAWVDGYAPGSARTTARDPKTGRPSFELVIERGSPMRALVVDGAGNAIPNALVRCAFATRDRRLNSTGKFVSDASGAVHLGHAKAGQAFEFEVRAHGWQWQRFASVSFDPDKPVKLTLRKANPVEALVVDARTQRPLADVNAFCLTRHGRMSSTVYTYGYSHSPDFKMSAHPSDASGRLTLDVCHADEQYQVLLEAPGYARQMVSVTGLSSSFQASMQPEIVLAGVIQDPENRLAEPDGTLVFSCFNQFGSPNSASVSRSQEFKSDGRGKTTFSFRNLAPGEVTLHAQRGGTWKARLDKTVNDLVLRVENGKLRHISGAEGAGSTRNTATRKVILKFHPPEGSPPYQGEVTLDAGHSRTAKVSDNVHSFDAPVGSSFHVYAGGATGYIFNIVRENVAPGEGPMQVDIHLRPAGAISGNIHWDLPEAEKAAHTEAVLLIQRPGDSRKPTQWETIHNQAGGLYRVLDGGKRYFISPVAFNNSYRVLLIGENSFAESEVFHLDEKAPLARKDITFESGTRVTAQIFEPDGTPMRSGGSVLLLYLIGGSSFQRWIDTDPDGSLALPHLNHEMSGKYFIKVPSTTARATLTRQLAPGTTTVRLQREKAEILEGRITNGDGKPVSGVQVSALLMDENTGMPLPLLAGIEYSDAPSNVDGQFRFSTLPKGTFRITVLTDEKEPLNLQKVVRDVKLTGQSGQRIDFKLTDR